MLVQIRRDSFRVFRQHDHALASGALAHEWVGVDSSSRPLSAEAVLAIALHDWAWREADLFPRLDVSTGEIVTFETYPADERRAFYSRGLDEVERIHPYAGLLGSLHYASFASAGPSSFVEGERRRQARLRRELGAEACVEERVESDLAYLRWFDNLSLFACLAGPLAISPPEWLSPSTVGRAPGGSELRLEWRGGEELLVSPFPFRREVPLSIPCRDLARGPWQGRELRRAWESAGLERHRVRVRGRR